jgi:hypothetical protein
MLKDMLESVQEAERGASHDVPPKMNLRGWAEDDSAGG